MFAINRAAACGLGIASFLAALAPSAFAEPASPDGQGYVLSEWNAKERLPPLLEGVENSEDWNAKAERVREVWLRYIGPIPERAPVRYEILSETQEASHVRQEIVYDTVYDDRVTAYFLIPNEALTNNRRYPAILALHPTNAQGKASVATAEGRKNRTYGYELVQRGYIVLAPDSLMSGDRIFKESQEAYPGNAHFRSAPFYERHPKWSTIAKHLVDHQQALDFLVQHERVDPDRIGAIGHSFGAYNAYFLAGMDRRVKAFVSSCGFCPILGGHEDHWAVRDPPRYLHIPKLQADLDRDRIPFEFHEIAALAAPTPGFFYNAQHDHIFPHWRQVAEGMAQLHDLYVLLGAQDRFVALMGTGGHDFPPMIRDAAYQFLDQWLKPEE